MPRRPRKSLLYDGCFAHVFSRSIETRHIFADDEELRKFWEVMLLSKQKHGFKVHHYCLMNTHYHMAVHIPSVDLFADGMKWAKREYTNWYNWRHKRRGSLWQERYKSLLIESEKYLHSCGLYIENNPIEAGMVECVTDWKYSSSGHYNLQKRDELVDSYDKPKPAPMAMEKDLFERGYGIGSDLFKIYLKEQLLSVP